MNSDISLSAIDLEENAGKAGLSLLGVLSLDTARNIARAHLPYLKHWQEAGYAGEMSYMLKDVELFAAVEKLLPEARSVVCFVVPYYQSELTERFEGWGRVARYAWGRDYHRVLRRRLKHLVQQIESSVVNEKICWRAFTDAVPLLERSLSLAAGLGFIGKNSILIRHGLGSYFFLAELIWNVEVDSLSNLQAPSSAALSGTEENIKLLPPRGDDVLPYPGNGCGTCTICLEGCPTDAIVGPGIIDSSRCIAYLTIEKKTPFTSWEAQAVGDWLFGCDVCQEVCPFNHHPGVSDIDEFAIDCGVGQQIELMPILAISSDEQFRARFSGTPLMRCGRQRLIRNACCVLMNTRYFPAIHSLRRVFSEDPSQMVRNQAHLALKGLVQDAEGLDKVRIMTVF